jgi:PA domain
VRVATQRKMFRAPRGRLIGSLAGTAVCVALAALPAAPATAHSGPLPSFIYSQRDAIAAPSLAVPTPASGCPTTTPDASLESTGRLLADNRVMSNFGQRPTASPNQMRFVDWLANSMAQVPGMRLGSVGYSIDRWLARGTGLAAGASTGSMSKLLTSGAVPYARTTSSAGVTAPLVYVPPGVSLAGQDIKGKIVVRDAVPGSVPFADFTAVEWFQYDPDGSLTTNAASGGVYERDFAGYQQRVDDLQAAGAASAAGLIFVHGFPRRQVQGQYAPYEGIHWQIPAVYVGADEGQKLKQLAAAHGVARMSVAADDRQAPTRMLIATLPGISPERIIIQSHTDGMNAIWDNGPIAMLALARRFAALPIECRPRTLQFIFTTGHIYQHLLGTADRGGSSELEAKELDKQYDQGSVAMVFAIEHLGAREYAAVPRTDGGPGRVLVKTGRTEVNTFFAGESPVLVNSIERAVVNRNIARTYVLRGSDVPSAKIPVQNSFGGEGTAYQQHLVPTIALVAGPWSLYNPSFGMEAIDVDLMRKQTLAFSDMIGELSSVPSALLAGGYIPERAVRMILCSQSGLATLGFTRCAGDPYG